MAYNLNNIKILIVEDMQPMLSLTISLLKMFGFKDVQGAKDVQDGYSLFCQHKHDIIITDWLMEPMDGIDLIKMVRRNENSPNKFVPIILMTGYSDQPRVETARDMGVTEFLMKPYSARDMYARIVQIVEKPRQFLETDNFFGPDRRRRKNFEFYGMNKRGDVDKNAESVMFNTPDRDIEIALNEIKNDVQKI